MTDEAMYAKDLKSLRAMPDAALIEAHDALLRQRRHTVGPPNYLTELARRDADRQTRTMVRLTWVVAGLTLANFGLIAYQVLQ